MTRNRFLCLSALLGSAACSAPQPQREWVHVGPPLPRMMAVLRAEQREIERVSALTDEQVRIELATGRRQAPAAPR